MLEGNIVLISLIVFRLVGKRFFEVNLKPLPGRGIEIERSARLWMIFVIRRAIL